MIRSSLFLGLLGASSTSRNTGVNAYFASVNNAHVEFVVAGEGSGEVAVENVVKDAIEGAAKATVESAVEKVKIGVAERAATEPELVARFETWATNFGREYESTEERVERSIIWLENHAFIEAHNNKEPKPSFHLGHNDFSDMTHDEFKRRFRLGEFAAELKRREGELKFADVEEPSLRGAAAVVADERQLEGGWNDWFDGKKDKKKKGKVKTDSSADHVDWTDYGVVGPVRDQGSCGACWAFSAVGAIEGAMAIEKLKQKEEIHGADFTKDSDPAIVELVVPLSEQNLIDCDRTANGCGGGLMETAFETEESTQGICSEAEYPYIAIQGPCTSDLCTPVPNSIVSDYIDVVPQSSGALKAALNKQPVSIAITAQNKLFQFYASGILEIDECYKPLTHGDDGCILDFYVGQTTCLPPVTHGVLAVGYGSDEVGQATTKDYFKIKNSWGTKWGEDGYIRLARYDDRDSNENGDNWGMCGILSLVSYPVM